MSLSFTTRVKEDDQSFDKMLEASASCFTSKAEQTRSRVWLSYLSGVGVQVKCCLDFKVY